MVRQKTQNDHEAVLLLLLPILVKLRERRWTTNYMARVRAPRSFLCLRQAKLAGGGN